MAHFDTKSDIIYYTVNDNTKFGTPIGKFKHCQTDNKSYITYTYSPYSTGSVHDRDYEIEVEVDLNNQKPNDMKLYLSTDTLKDIYKTDKIIEREKKIERESERPKKIEKLINYINSYVPDVETIQKFKQTVIDGLNEI